MREWGYTSRRCFEGVVQGELMTEWWSRSFSVDVKISFPVRDGSTLWANQWLYKNWPCSHRVGKYTREWTHTLLQWVTSPFLEISKKLTQSLETVNHKVQKVSQNPMASVAPNFSPSGAAYKTRDSDAHNQGRSKADSGNKSWNKRQGNTDDNDT